MTITVNQAIANMFSTASGPHYDRAVSECTQLAILTGVSKGLKPEQDFGLTGHVIYNGTLQQWRQQNPAKLLSSLDDYSLHDVRFVFSTIPIKDFTRTASIFTANLVVRISAVDDVNGYMTLDVLRNKYGTQQFRNYFKIV